MKITFNFNESTRSLVLLPEDELELCVLNDMATQCAKGTTLTIVQFDNFEKEEKQFSIEMKVNGK